MPDWDVCEVDIIQAADCVDGERSMKNLRLRVWRLLTRPLISPCWISARRVCAADRTGRLATHLIQPRGRAAPQDPTRCGAGLPPRGPPQTKKPRTFLRARFFYSLQSDSRGVANCFAEAWEVLPVLQTAEGGPKPSPCVIRRSIHVEASLLESTHPDAVGGYDLPDQLRYDHRITVAVYQVDQKPRPEAQ